MRNRKTKAEVEVSGVKKPITIGFDPDVIAAVEAEAAEQFSNRSEVVNLRLASIYRAENPAAFPVTAATQQRDRKGEIENELLEMKLARERGELIRKAVAMALVEKDYAVIRSRLLAIPQAVFGLTPSQLDELKKAVQDCMTDLSGDQQGAWDDID